MNGWRSARRSCGLLEILLLNSDLVNLSSLTSIDTQIPECQFPSCHKAGNNNNNKINIYKECCVGDNVTETVYSVYYRFTVIFKMFYVGELNSPLILRSFV